VNPGDLSCPRLVNKSGTDAPGDQKDAKAELRRKHRSEASKSEAMRPVSSRKSGWKRGVGASIVPSPGRGNSKRREEDEKAKLVRGKGTQVIR
jgi:hypothetical protein